MENYLSISQDFMGLTVDEVKEKMGENKNYRFLYDDKVNTVSCDYDETRVNFGISKAGIVTVISFG